MGAANGSQGGKPISVAVRVTEAELERLDAVRGFLTRSAYLRLALLDAVKRDKEAG